MIITIIGGRGYIQGKFDNFKSYSSYNGSLADLNWLHQPHGKYRQIS